MLKVMTFFTTAKNNKIIFLNDLFLKNPKYEKVQYYKVIKCHYNVLFLRFRKKLLYQSIPFAIDLLKFLYTIGNKFAKNRIFQCLLCKNTNLKPD